MPEGNAINLDPDDEYLDVLVASIEEIDSDEQNGEVIFVGPEGDDMVVRLKEEQERDANLSWIIGQIKVHKDKQPSSVNIENKIQRKLIKQYKNLVLQNELLYYASEDELGMQILKFVIQQDSIKRIIKTVHEKCYGGHLGRRKTYKKIAERFYRPGLKQVVYD
jgi:hypothetical protein